MHSKCAFVSEWQHYNQYYNYCGSYICFNLRALPKLKQAHYLLDQCTMLYLAFWCLSSLILPHWNPSVTNWNGGRVPKFNVLPHSSILATASARGLHYGIKSSTLRYNITLVSLLVWKLVIILSGENYWHVMKLLLCPFVIMLQIVALQATYPKKVSLRTESVDILAWSFWKSVCRMVLKQ